jgi:hypothetical protein
LAQTLQTRIDQRGKNSYQSKAERRRAMANIEIRDLELDEELDRKAMGALLGGCFYPSPLGVPNPVGLFHSIRLKFTLGSDWWRVAYWLGPATWLEPTLL